MLKADRTIVRPRPRGSRAAIAAAALLAGCSSLDPTGLLDSDTAEPKQVDAGQESEPDAFPKLGEVPDEPDRRPSDRAERQAMQESLAADRTHARYSDEALRAPEAAETQSAAKRQPQGAPGAGRNTSDPPARAAEPGSQDGSGSDPSAARRDASAQAEDREQTATPGEDVAADADASAAESGAQAMPDVPPAPSETAAREAEAASGKGADRTAGSRTAARGAPDKGRGGGGAAAIGDTDADRAGAGETSVRAGEPEDAAGTGTAAQGPARSGENGRAAAGRNGAAVQVNRSQIPQIQPSREGEPVRLPTRVRQRVGTGTGDGAASGGAQTARLQTPPASAGQVQPQADTGAAGQQLAVIYFGHAGAGLNGEDRQVLQKVAKLYKKRGGNLRVVGHASSRTATMDMIRHRMVNLDISMRRAENVADALVRYGVPRGRITVEARAARDPEYHEFMPTGEAGNRRAEIFLTN